MNRHKCPLRVRRYFWTWSFLGKKRLRRESVLRSWGYSVRQNIDLVGYPKMAIKQSWACYEVITSRKKLAPWSYHLSEWPRFCSAQCGITSRKGLPSCWLTATTPQGNASLHNRITSRNGLGALVHAGSRHNAARSCTHQVLAVLLLGGACGAAGFQVFSTRRANVYLEVPGHDIHYLSAQDVVVPSRRHNETGSRHQKLNL